MDDTICICPVCYRAMMFHLDYFNGIPFVYYTCYCGYSTLDQKIIYSNHT